MTRIFSMTRYFGVSTCKPSIAFGWTVILFLMLLAIEVGAIWKIVRLLGGWAVHSTDSRGFTARLSGCIFYGNALLSLILSIKFVSSWEQLSERWSRTETDPGLRLPSDSRIKRRTVLVSAFVMTCACVEHMLSMMSATGFDCPPEEYMERYILSSHGFLVQNDEYNLWLAIPIFIMSKLATALWNFQDLIIILISMGFTSRYNRLNTYVHRVVMLERNPKEGTQVSSENYMRFQIWRRIRQAYVRQAALVRLVDDQLGALVLLSNVNNLYFICLQLFLGINSKDRGSFINRLYYFISLGWLMFRACGVVLAAADVYIHSKKALISLYLCPELAYNLEIKRLKYQLKNDEVALTGMGLFSLNRELLLEVAAAVLKYELVLVQYDK